MNLGDAKALLTADIGDFSIKLMTEVFKVNDDGRYSQHVALFEDENLAEAFRQNQVDANYHKCSNFVALTNGKVAFKIGETSLPVSNEGEVKIRLFAAIKKKLSPAEQAAIGMKPE